MCPLLACVVVMSVAALSIAAVASTEAADDLMPLAEPRLDLASASAVLVSPGRADHRRIAEALAGKLEGRDELGSPVTAVLRLGDHRSGGSFVLGTKDGRLVCLETGA